MNLDSCDFRIIFVFDEFRILPNRFYDGGICWLLTDRIGSSLDLLLHICESDALVPHETYHPRRVELIS